MPLLLNADKPVPGFRANELGWWTRDRHSAFAEQAEMRYLAAENWSENRLRARGGLPDRVRSAKVALVGVGALGSVLAELLVRAGVRHLALFDGDTLSAGNICRHTATLGDVGNRKVDVARRLMQISPHVEVVTHGNGLPASPDDVHGALEHYDAIVDCTASSDLLSTLGRAWWSMPRLFVSASVGYAARRLFVFAAFGNEFPNAEFEVQIRPCLEQETSAWADHGELLEGPGCWSPLFPARHDDLVLAAAVCLKELASWVERRPSEPVLHVFEQAVGDHVFRSLARVDDTTRQNRSGRE